MAVQAQQCLSHAFLPHELGQAFRSLDGAAAGGGGMWFDELGGGGGCAAGGIGDAVFGQPRSEVTSNGNDDIAAFLPRKRARVSPAAAAGLMEIGQQGLALPLAFPQGHMFAGDVQSRVVGCGAASTSGRSAAAIGGSACLSQGVVSQLYHQGVEEVDVLVRLEMERMRLGLQEAGQRHLRAVVAAVERASAGRLRAAEAEVERARHRNAELEERLRQLAAEGQAWLGVAKSHEAVAAGLRATLDQLLLQQQHAAASGVIAGADGVDAEDAQSCCFEAATVADDAASGRRGAHQPCKSCGAADACVLLLPCRHLCLCRACEPAADACPVCAATKNASLQVLLS